jgi:hypothetical protein
MSEPADIDPFGAEWDRPRLTNRLTWVLVAAVVAALTFAGGLLIERQYDSTILTAARGSARATGGGLAIPGIGGGGRRGATRNAATGSGAGAAGDGAAGAGTAGPGAGGPGGGSSDGAGGAGAGGAGAAAAASDGAGGSAGDAPVAVGTVASVSADRLTLTNFAGKTITVTVPPTATVTTSGLAGLKPGAPASVTGTANPDGSVTATSITSRTTGR